MPRALDLAEVDFDNYDVIIVASDYGGWLRQDELDILNDRADDVVDFVNAGGGLIALAESGDRTADSAAVYTGTTTDRYTPVNVSGLVGSVAGIAPGGFHTCALTTLGGVKCWGANWHGQLGNGVPNCHTTPVEVVGSWYWTEVFLPLVWR